MNKTLWLFMGVFCLMLYGCGTSIPGCDDKEVRDLLDKLVKKSGLTLEKLSGVRTVSKQDNVCNCSALATLSGSGEREEIGIAYIIELADNKKEFTVELRWQ